MGGYIIGLLLLMFLLSIGYSNNLMLIFTLILFAFNLMWLVEGHFHMNDLKYKSIQISNGHAGELIPVTIRWMKSPASPWRWQLTLETEKDELITSSLNFNHHEAHAFIQAPARGLQAVKYIKVESDRPHGLYKTWIFFNANSSFLSYPALKSVNEVELSGNSGEGEISSDKKGDDDFKSLAPYQGEEARKISWKHYARVGELVVKEGEEHQASIVKFELQLPENPEQAENYLSTLASEMVFCHRKMIPFSFKSGSFYKHPGSDFRHLNECLAVLALC
jgi:uncharacterized protein (DUF58 family)